ncbi:hypothetical protein HKD37_09G024285 [Glycine soja]
MILFGSSSASNCLSSLHLVYSPHYRVYRSSLYMPKPPKSIFHHLLYNRRYSNPLSNSFVSNFILSSLITHPPQHPHLRYTYFILMLALDRPTFCSVQNRRSYRNSLFLTLQVPPFDPWCYHRTSSLCPISNSYIHNQNSMLGSQALSRDNFTVQAILPIRLPDKEEIYLRTCPSTFVKRSKASENSKMDLPSPFISPRPKPPCTPSKPLATLPTCPLRSPPRKTFSPWGIS